MRRLWTHRDIDAPAPVVWQLLCDLERWPDWGPSVRSASLDGQTLSLGATGRVTTAVGVDLSFTITEFEANAANKHAKDPAVRQAMAGALAAGAANLTEAYDRAVWSLPHLRDGLLADREATARKAAADKVKAAQSAAVSLRGGSPNGSRPASLSPAMASGATAEGAARAALASLRGG